MKRRGVLYDVGRVMGGNWRPDYDPRLVHRELEIIKQDLHCNAVRICGRSIDRLTVAAEAALSVGLEVWLSPELWNKSPGRTLAYISKAAIAAEALRRQTDGRLVFSVGSELTLFMQGIVPGRTFMGRLKKAFSGELVRSGAHNRPLNEFLAQANEAVRRVFHGQVTYAALSFEAVEWGRFDFVGVDHYWSERIKDRYVEMLKPLFGFGKPVVVTEFGFRTTKTPPMGGALAFGNVDHKRQFLHQMPVVGRFIRPRLTRIDERDEEMQAQRLLDQLTLLDGAGVDGSFIMTFVAPLNPYSDVPLHDLDRESYSLVKSLGEGRRGTVYPDMGWEPKQSFHAVADYYGRQAEVLASPDRRG